MVSPDYTKFELAVKYMCESNNGNRRKKRGANGDYIIKFYLSFNFIKKNQLFLEQSVINDILAMDICEGFETSFTTKWEDFKA